jgi:hypothetical protein
LTTLQLVSILLYCFQNIFHLINIKKSTQCLLKWFITVKLFMKWCLILEWILFCLLLMFSSLIFQVNYSIKKIFLFIFQIKFDQYKSSICLHNSMINRQFWWKRCFSSSDNKIFITICIISYYLCWIICTKNFNWFNIITCYRDLDIIITGKESKTKIIWKIFF